MNVPRMASRGGFALGLIVGLLVGLALALGVALYITKAPVPFINKVPQRTAEHDQAEAERNRNWDPNAPLAGKGQRAAGSVSAPAAEPAASTPRTAAAPATAAASRPAAARDPAAILAGGGEAARAEAFDFFVQAGAFARADDAEQQRAKLALAGFSGKVSEREQSGRTVWRVRIGPFATRDEAAREQDRLKEAGVEAQIVRVEKP